MSDNPIDLEKFYRLLVECGEAAFLNLRRDLHEEGIYSLAFYTHQEYCYVMPTCSTLVGLNTVARKYKTLDYYKNFSVETLEKRLKWSPCDSPHHGRGDEFFIPVSDFLDDIYPADVFQELYDPDNNDWSKAEKLEKDMEETLILALIELDRRQVFGTGNERESIVVNLLMGDRSMEDIVRTASRINYDTVVVRLLQELQDGFEASISEEERLQWGYDRADINSLAMEC